MTDRLKGLTVTFEDDIRADDAEQIIEAIQMIKGVLDVTPTVRTGEDHMNRERIRHEMRERLYDALNED